MLPRNREDKATPSRKIPAAILGIFVISILLVPTFAATTSTRGSLIETSQANVASDPLGHFQGTGISASISWTGDGQRINNPSFETGTLSPWVQSQYNAAAGSSASVTTPGYNSADSAQLIVFSGNFTSGSYTTLLNDLTQQRVGFSSALRFRAAVQPQQMTGTSSQDRIEASLSLTTSTGNVRVIHYVFASGGTVPANGLTDAYFVITANPLGQWTFIDRNVANDAFAVFPSDYPNIDSVSQATITVFAQTAQGAPNHDPHIKFWNPNTTQYHSWQSGLPVVYDTNNGAYGGMDYVLGGCTPGPCAPPPTGAPLYDDPLIKYVDSNNNGIWDTGEPIVYDCNTVTCNTNIYSFYDPIIYGSTPPVGTLLTKIVQNHTTALFDGIELYSATGGAEWIKNGYFHNGLTSWGPNSNYTLSPGPGTPIGARGTVTNYDTVLGQSIDAKPSIDGSMTFNAAANIASMTGSSSSDLVDISLGLVDSQFNPISINYVFKTGDGSTPANRTDAIYHKAAGFGTTNLWLSVNDSLTQETTALNLLGYNAPYNVEIVTLEVIAHGSSSTTNAYFGSLSLHSATRTGTAQSIFYAADGFNTTYLYTASAIPQGSLQVQLPSPGQSILNITSPSGTALNPAWYATAKVCPFNPCNIATGPGTTVNIPESTFFKYAPIGDWRIFATSTNPVSTLYAEDPSTHNQALNINVGSTVNFVSQIKNPFGLPLAGTLVNLTLWNAESGAEVASWPGPTNSLGWWNVSGITLPLAGTPPGVYSLQATVNTSYSGLGTFPISVRHQVNLTINLSTGQISQGSSITISGTVTETATSSPAQGVVVTLRYRLAGDSQWTNLANVTSDSSGQYSYIWAPPQGDYQVESIVGDTTTAHSDSSLLQLSVGPQSFLQQYWFILVGVAAAIVAIVAVIMVRQARKPILKQETA